MSIDQDPIRLRKPGARPPMETDLADSDLLHFALGFADRQLAAPTVESLLAEFGDVEVILATEPEVLRERGGLSNRAVAILKLIHAFRSDNRSGGMLH